MKIKNLRISAIPRSQLSTSDGARVTFTLDDTACQITVYSLQFVKRLLQTEADEPNPSPDLCVAQIDATTIESAIAQLDSGRLPPHWLKKPPLAEGSETT